MKALKAIAWRFLRGTIATAAAGWIVKWQNDVKYAWLIPVLLAAGKAVRDKWPGKFEWLPV